MRSRQYSQDVLAAPSRRPGRPPRIEAENGLVVEDSAAEFCGAVVGCEKDAVTLEDRFGRRRVFPLSRHVPAGGQAGSAGRRPSPAQRRGPARTASGSIAAPVTRAKMARASRIYVEGRHDAELVERVWGDDLRDAGVVVEFLNGIDDLPAIVADFAPAGAAGWACSWITWSAAPRKAGSQRRSALPDVLIVGHPFIDVWAAVKPARARH